MKKLISILLLAAMLVLALAACGNGDKKKTTAPTTTAPTTTAPTTTDPTVTEPPVTEPPVTTDPWEQISADVKAMDANLRDFIISMTTDQASAAKNVEYVQGPATRDGATTIQGYVYDRNQEAYTKLGLTVRYDAQARDWMTGYTTITNACQATQIATSPDLYADLMFSMVGAAINGSFRELTSIRGSYLNFNTQGWFTDIMSDISFDRERLFLLASDYYLDIIRNMIVMPFNIELLNEKTDDADLVAAITGNATWSDEGDLADYLFEIVREGEWTFDKLTEICEAFHIDSDTTSGDSEGDSAIGLLVDAGGGIMTSGFLYSTDTECFRESTDENGLLVMTYPETGDQIANVFRATEKLINAKGTYIMRGEGTTEVNKKIRDKFAAGEAFAIAGELLAYFETDEYTGMRYEYSVLPMPLLEAGTVDNYNTPIHNCATVGGIAAKSAKYLPITAFIQYVTEHELTQSIREEYLYSIMKYDIISYNPGTDEMLEIVYDHVKSCREMIVENIIWQQKRSTIKEVVDPRWHGMLKANDLLLGSFLSSYEAVRNSKQAALNDLLATWRALPMGDVPAAE